jgi:hypothetical protein
MSVRARLQLSVPVIAALCGIIFLGGIALVIREKKNEGNIHEFE